MSNDDIRKAVTKATNTIPTMHMTDIIVGDLNITDGRTNMMFIILEEVRELGERIMKRMEGVKDDTVAK